MANERDEKQTQDEGRTGRDQKEPGRMKNETAIRQQEETRSELDRGYGSDHKGDEFNDVKVEDNEEAA